MKAPTITNKQHYHSYPKNANEACRHLQTARNKIFETNESFAVPFMMLQVRLDPVKEVKLVFMGGEFQYIMASGVSNVYMSLKGHTTKQLIEFATSAIQRVSRHDEYILDGVVRVDLFQNNDGKLVVNEFESLEARRYASCHVEFDKLTALLDTYWEKMIYKAIALL